MINNSSISLYRNSFNSVVKNFEFLLTIATGKYIYFSDQDDIWVTDKLEITQKAFESGFELVLSDCKIIDETDNIIGDSFFERNHSGKGFLKNLYKNSYIGCCLAISSSVKSKVLPFGKNIPMHDYWIGLYLEFFHPDKICFLKEQLVLYRKHIGNISNTAIGVSQNSLFKKLKIRLYLIYYILKFS